MVRSSRTIQSRKICKYQEKEERNETGRALQRLASGILGVHAIL
jgi:hypothetical protein